MTGGVSIRSNRDYSCALSVLLRDSCTATGARMQDQSAGSGACKKGQKESGSNYLTIAIGMSLAYRDVNMKAESNLEDDHQEGIDQGPFAQGVHHHEDRVASCRREEDWRCDPAHNHEHHLEVRPRPG